MYIYLREWNKQTKPNTQEIEREKNERGIEVKSYALHIKHTRLSTL